MAILNEETDNPMPPFWCATCGLDLQSAAALAQHDAQTVACFEPIARNNLIETVFGEEVGPALQFVIVHAVCIRGAEILYPRAQCGGCRLSQNPSPDDTLARSREWPSR